MLIKNIFYKSPRPARGFYKRGFTLVELLLAVALIVFGVIAVVSVMSSGMSSDMTVEGQIKALNLAQEKMEEVKNTAYASVASDARAAVTGFSGYEREVVVSGTPKQVTVYVYWTHQGVQQTLSLVTLLTDLGG